MKCRDCINHGICCRWEDKKKGGCGLTDVRWISVSERLPEEDGEYLVTVKRGYVATGLWVGNAGYWNEVIAWMPLPKPYEPQESEVEE